MPSGRTTPLGTEAAASPQTDICRTSPSPIRYSSGTPRLATAGFTLPGLSGSVLSSLAGALCCSWAGRRIAPKAIVAANKIALSMSALNPPLNWIPFKNVYSARSGPTDKGSRSPDSASTRAYAARHAYGVTSVTKQFGNYSQSWAKVPVCAYTGPNQRVQVTEHGAPRTTNCLWKCTI